MQSKITYIVQIQHRQEEKYPKLHEGERNPHTNVMENTKTIHKRRTKITHKRLTQNHRLKCVHGKQYNYTAIDQRV